MRRTEEDMLNEIEQYVGKIFPGTQMTILGYGGRNHNGLMLVECSSASRGKFTAVWHEVKRGNTKGTVKGELRRRRNRFQVSNGVVTVLLNSDKHFICDEDALELVKRYTWYFNQNGYARSSEGEYFHRLVMDVPDGYIVDHINGDRLDNRKCNLRICKPADNSHNMKMFSTNSSGHTGVYKTKNGKYGAVIVSNYNSIRLGVFDDYESACDAYNEAKKKYHRVEGGAQNSEFAGPD